MENYFCMSIRVFANFIKNTLKKKSASLGLTSFQCAVLNYVNYCSEKQEVVFQKNLEEFFLTSKSSMSDLLQSLENKGLIIRISLENGDSRKKKITLTKEGKKITSIVDASLDEVENCFISSLNAEEKEQLFKIFAKFHEKMEEDYEC